MAIAENDFDGVVADRIEPHDRHVALAPHQLFLAGSMALHFGTGTFDAQVLGIEPATLAGVEPDVEQPAAVAQAQFLRPRISHGSGPVLPPAA